MSKVTQLVSSTVRLGRWMYLTPNLTYSFSHATSKTQKNKEIQGPSKSLFHEYLKEEINQKEAKREKNLKTRTNAMQSKLVGLLVKKKKKQKSTLYYVVDWT